MKNTAFWDVELCGFVRTDVSVECVTSIFRVEKIREQRKALAVG
jgi:hypothetical protein